MELFVAITSFLLILAALLFLRSKGTKFEIKTPDIIVAILPVMIFLIVSGKLSKFEISESGLKIETAITEAAKNNIAGLEQSLDLEKLPSQRLAADVKGDIGEIPELINRKTEALIFKVGYPYYAGNAIQKYLLELTEKPYLKYLLFTDTDNKFLGLAPVQRVVKEYGDDNQPYQLLAEWLRQGNLKLIEQTIPGYITKAQSLNKDSTRAQALSQMLTQKVNELPVLDDQGYLSGVVDKSSVSGSLILQIAQSLESQSP